MTRIEAGQEQLARESVDLVQILRDCWSTVEMQARARGVTPAWRVPERLPLVTSPTHVALVAANLLDNAVSHGAANGAVQIEVARGEAGVELRVSNACSGEPPAAAARTTPFQIFFRSDEARSSERHFGLGLTLCDRVVRLLGGEIKAAQLERRFVVTVTLPTTPAA